MNFLKMKNEEKNRLIFIFCNQFNNTVLYRNTMRTWYNINVAGR